nr:Fimbrial protein [Raoultella sp. NCTC 9187]
MYSGYRTLQFLFLLATGIYTHYGWARAAAAAVGQMTINVQNIKYLPTLPGQHANDQRHGRTTAGGIHFVCDLQLPTASMKRIIYKQRNTAGSPRVINGQHVYDSALSGMGYSLGFQCEGGAIRYIDGGSAPAGGESMTVCDSAQMSTLLAQRETGGQSLYHLFIKPGDIPLVSGNHTSVAAQPQVGNLYIEKQDSGSGATRRARRSASTSPPLTWILAPTAAAR